jgi:hypothetical protein
MTETPMTASMLKLPAMREGAGAVPAGRRADRRTGGRRDGLAAGDGAARLTGQVIAVDGGFTTVRPLVR